MPRSTSNRSVLASLAAFGLTLLFAGCATDNGVTPDLAGVMDSTGFTPISLAQATSEAASGLRMEVRVKRASSPLVAIELALDPPSAAGDAEQVQANIMAVDRSGSGGTITTDLGNFKISFDGNTVFSKDEAGVALTADEFAALVGVALAANQHPHVRARRAPPESPQAPDDASFLASQIVLGGTSDALKIDLNVGKDNLALNSAPPPDAFLRVLGLQIEIRISDGTTRIGHRENQPGQTVEFGGKVESVYPERSGFVLVGGLGVLVTDKTVIEGDDLKSLADVEDAMKAGFGVGAKGTGVVSSTNPRVISAARVHFEKFRLVFEFRELVKSVDLAASKLTLSSGAVLCFATNTVIDQTGDFKSLEEVAAALAAGKTVGASGAASPAPDGSGCRALALKVRFIQAPTPPPPPPPVTEFHDLVKAADAAGNKVTLNSGIVLCLDDHTVIDQTVELKSLADVAAALAAGKHVYAAGGVIPAAAGSGCAALVLKVRFVVVPPPTTTAAEFHEGVKAVDVAGKKITLSNDAVICVEQAAIVQEGDFKTLASVAEAIAAGKNMKADGTANPAPDGAGCRANAVKVKFSIRI